nr:hypothetical protein BaRGS_008109 [Batillaria attramentaria]
MATDDTGLLAKEAVLLLKGMKANAADLRGIGIQTHRLESVNFGTSAASAVPKGNQSILNFAVANKQTSEKSSVVQNAEDKGGSTAGGSTGTSVLLYSAIFLLDC